MKLLWAATLVAVLTIIAGGCASTQKKAALVAPKGAEYIGTGEESQSVENVRMVAQMDDIGDYSLDGKAPVKKKKIKKPNHRTRFSSSFGY